MANPLTFGRIRLATSDLLQRLSLAARAGVTYAGNRKVFETCGYKLELTCDDYRARYMRNGIAARVVEAAPKATWRGGAGGVELIEDQDPEVTTPFEQAFIDLDKRLGIWSCFARADILAGLGRYAVVLLGAPGRVEDPLPDSINPEQLVYLTPFSEEDARVSDSDLDVDPTSVRFGKPKRYQIGRMGRLQTAVKTVHWSRVIHIAEGTLDDPVYGTPRLERVWNLLDDLEKITGAGAEAFWKRADRGLFFNIDKDLDLTGPEETALESQVEEFQHNLRRVIALRGSEITPLGSDVANFQGQVDSILKLIAGATGIPNRILVGSERGELSSTQDKTNWDEQISDRRREFAEPKVVRPFVDICIKTGILPVPDEYEVRWPELGQLDESLKADIAVKWAGLNGMAGGTVVLPEEIRDRVLRLEALTPEQQAAAQPPAPPTPTGEPTQAPVTSSRWAAAAGWKRVARVAGGQWREIRKVVLRNLLDARSGVDLEALEKALGNREPGGVESVLSAALAGIPRAMQEELGMVLLQTAVAAGAAEAVAARKGGFLTGDTGNRAKDHLGLKAAGGPGSGWTRSGGHIPGSQGGVEKTVVDSDRLVNSVRVSAGKMIVESKLKPELDTTDWLHPDEKVGQTQASVIVDLPSGEMPYAYIARVDTIGRVHKGYGRETLEATLGLLKTRGILEARAYTEKANLSAHSMNTALGGKIIEHGPHGYVWSFDLRGSGA